MAKLTKSYIDRLPLPSRKAGGQASQAIYRDESLSGFGILVGSGGTKSFFIERRIKGRVKRISIGRYGHLTPTQARLKAQEILGEIALGNDPASKKKAQAATATTLQGAFADYLQARKDLKPGTIKNYRQCMDGCLSDWLPRRLVDIDKEMVEVRHRKIGARAPGRANNTMRVLRAVFNHAIEKYEDDEGKAIFTFNPVNRLGQTRAWYRIDRRRTYIERHELAKWYEATMALSQTVTRDFLHFLLFTGLRKMEGARLRWENVSFEGGTFTIPDTKNRIPHTLPLTDFLRELLERRHAASSGPWVFQSPRGNDFLREPRGSLHLISEAMGKRVTLHDLRRTFLTVAEGLDIPAYALKRLINHHDSNDVTAGYIVSGVERLREPMQRITDTLNTHMRDAKNHEL